ncbi:uncharacterized protein LOC116215131 [Punica granatum]|uniref:Uncharacterized protein LOC116215131 n=2 Tax=Punica granatum TaxID=22663 RepID=A0A6P8EIR2_PUNGR|nr:uncharacterized protein LOC116215131 [Punica granatum]XP_031406583.1 uncharacterized protein LOC116215131 [Punica granatum]XP_031406585.1 uncharacterized protein LOC116215131 [Punica granatum]OWM85835.1 hypothetical protein CDL15_Pgr012085 [Punica granatum]PKI77472.1 hypothetical protein CRG98_002078 [Punica granatum]
MDSPQSVVSSFKSSVVPEVQKQPSDFFARNSAQLTEEIEFNGSGMEGANGGSDSFIGSLEVYIHQARDIHNICIYHKQDVYAKLCLTSDPENTVSTKIINGGGRNPVFNDNLQLNVRKVDCSLKCEVWMLSRVKNYLEDQLLGFALVPLSEVIMKNGKLEKEFSLSSTDLFHSPAGFVQLSLSYHGASPEVMEITPLPSTDVTTQESEATEPTPSEFDKIEFPDPKIVNENEMMVSEYFGIPCESLESETSESLVTSDAENQVHSEENSAKGAFKSIQPPELDSPPSSVSTNGVSSPSVPASSQSSETPAAAVKSPTPSEEHESKSSNVAQKDHTGDSESSVGISSSPIAKPVITVNLEPEKNAVQQQDIVDMYMKSMQQFTESLAKMKLPMDIESEKDSPGKSSSSEEKLQQASKNNGSRVFYGSRAFF